MLPQTNAMMPTYVVMHSPQVGFNMLVVMATNSECAAKIALSFMHTMRYREGYNYTVTHHASEEALWYDYKVDGDTTCMVRVFDPRKSGPDDALAYMSSLTT